MIHVTRHAIERYQERVANVSDDDAREALSTRALQVAAQFGARFVRLATGHRVLVENGCAITVLPVFEKRAHFAHYCRSGGD